MGAVFRFRRDPSREHKYVCVCGAAFPNPYTLRYHVNGKPSKSRGPCHSIYTKAIDIVTNNTICDDDTKPINYGPSREDGDVEIMSEIDVDNVDPDESVHSECDTHVDHYTHLNNDNTDFHRILMDNDLALDSAIKTLQKARSDIKKLLQNRPPQ
ncbi:hypothetical protein BGX33_000722 [Mortierella sp. NVP41]|nr:hypothetical protein BGX33_000722 [Mortierella sp. NVP41]